MASRQPATPSTVRSETDTPDSNLGISKNVLADLIAQICNERLDKFVASHSGSSTLIKSPSLESVPGPSQPVPTGDPSRLIPMISNPWRSCETTLWRPDTRELELGSGARLSVDAIEFLDPSSFPNTMWRRKSIDSDDPPQKEIVLLQPRVLEKAQLELVRAHKGGYTSKVCNSQASSSDRKHSAVQMDPAKAPVLCKILAFANEKTREFLLNKTRPKLEETRPFQPALLEPNPPRAPWTGFFEASLGDRLLADAAMQQTGEKGFAKISKNTIAEELTRRSLFLNLVSSIAIMELVASESEAPKKDCILASVKHLLRPLLNLQFDWIQAKFDCRKQALAPMDLGHPNTQKLLYSSMFGGSLFDASELEATRKVAEKRCVTVVDLLGYKKPGDNKKRKTEEGGSAHVLDKRPQKHQKRGYSNWKKTAQQQNNSNSQSAKSPAATQQQQKTKPQPKQKAKTSETGNKQNV